METITLNDKSFEPFITATEIETIISTISNQINKDEIEKPLFIAILNGSFLFAADLARKITLPDTEMSFVKLASYQGMESSGEVKELVGLTADISKRNIIIIEDIIDTGNTLVAIKKLFTNKGIASFKVATLLFKPESYNKDISIDYIGKSIPNDFVVGYGLDYDEIGRNLPHIYKLKN